MIIQFPSNVTSCDLIINTGKFEFDGIKHIGTWKIGTNNPKILPNISGTVNRSMYDDCDDYTVVKLGFTITNYAASSLRVKTVECSTKSKKFVKNTTVADKYFIKV